MHFNHQHHQQTHLNHQLTLTGAYGLLCGHESHHLQVLARLDLALLDAARHHRASAGDGEGVLHGHQKALLRLAHGRGDRRLHLYDSEW